MTAPQNAPQLPNFTFKIKESKTGLSTIYLQTYWNRKRILVTTKRTINADNWNTRIGRPKKTTSDLYKLDRDLSDIEERAQELFNLVGGDRFKAVFEIEVLGEDSESTFFNAYAEFINWVGIHRSEKTQKKYIFNRDKLKDYEQEYHTKLTFEKVDIRFYDNLLEMFKGRSYRINTIGKEIRAFKTFMKWTETRGYHRNFAYKSFKSMNEEIPVVFLTQEELAILERLALEPRLERVRDLLVVSCYTGLRFSDVQNLKPESVVRDEIRKTSIKTKEHDTIIPLLPQAKRVLEKYPDGLPKISNTKANLYLKEIGQVAGFDKKVVQVRFINNERVEELIPRWKQLTTHIGRKTFVTLSFEYGISEAVVMSITGHKDYATMKKYLKVTDQRKKKDLFSGWKRSD